MIEQITNILNQQRTNHDHLVALCTVTGNQEDHSVHLMVLTDNDDPDNPIVLVNENLEATVEDFRRNIDTISEFSCSQLNAYIPAPWALFYGCNGNEISALKEILDDAIDGDDWSLNDQYGIGLRIEIK